MTIHLNRIGALGVAGAIAIGFAVSAGPVFAAPFSSNTAALKQVDVTNVVDVQWRRRRNAGPWIAGAALGIIGGIVAAEAYQNRYYDDGYAYGAYGSYGSYPYGAPYPTYGYYAPYSPYSPYSNCFDRPEAC